MKSRTLHISELSTKDACIEQIVVFYETFGEQVEVTVSLARKFGEMFDIPFAANRLLSGSALVKFHAGYVLIMGKREALRAPIEARYKVECEPARMKHIAACKDLFDDDSARRMLRLRLTTEYNAECADALAKYNEKCAPIWDAFMADRAALWATCYIKDEVPK